MIHTWSVDLLHVDLVLGRVEFRPSIPVQYCHSIHNMPVILCLHGAGSSAAIFRFQTSRLRAELPEDYEFVYIDGPLVSSPGPGMLPVFADAGPFYVWFGLSESRRAQEIDAVHQKLKEVNYAVQAGKIPGVRSREIIGIMAFSQGAVASTLLLLQQANGELSGLPKLHFAILVCSDFTSEVMDYVNSKSLEQKQVLVPSLHLHGDTDPYGVRSRMMLWTHYDEERCDVLTFQGAHHLPQLLTDCKQSAQAIIELVHRSCPQVEVLGSGCEATCIDKQEIVVHAVEVVDARHQGRVGG